MNDKAEKFNMPLSDRSYRDRVLEEKEALDAKHAKLIVFLGGDVFKSLPGDERERLRRQATAMRAYSDILRERIEAWRTGAAGMTVRDQRIIETVARGIIANDLISDFGADWGDFPEIGERDWVRIEDEIRAIAASIDPAPEEYMAAYAVLAARADKGFA